MKRRAFLQVAGASVLAAPFAFRRGGDALAQNPAAPKRVILFYSPYGQPTGKSGGSNHFWPQGSEPASKVLDELSAYKDKLTLLRGYGTRGIGDNHPFITQTLRSGATGSIDNLLGETLSQGAARKVLHLGAVPRQSGNVLLDVDLFFDAAGNVVSEQPNPVKVYDDLFSVFDGTDGGLDASTLKAMAAGLNLEEVQALESRAAGTKFDAQKLSRHADALTQLKSGPGDPGAGCQTKPVIPSIEALRPNAGDALYFENIANIETILNAQFDLATEALTCGLTRVVAIKLAWANMDLAFAGQSTPYHSASHGGPDVHLPYATFVAKKFGELCGRLMAKEDPEDPAKGTLLDNSVAMWISEIDDGNAHNSDSLPIVLVGSGGGFFKTGQYINHSEDTGGGWIAGTRSHGDVLLTLAKYAGSTVTSFGNSAGVVEELLA